MDVLQRSNLCLGLLKIQTTGVVRVEFRELATLGITLSEELVIVQTTVISWYTIKVAHILGLGAFFVGEESFVHLLAMADANDLNILLLATKELADSFSLCLDGTSWSLLNEDITVLTMLEGK